MIEEMMQRRVQPRNAVGVGQFLEAVQILLRDLWGGFLIIRIAIVDSTAERPRLARRAEVALLKRTVIRRHGPFIRRRGREQDFGFEIAEEQRVAVLFEAAAATAGDAYWPGGGHVAIDFLIEL